MMSWGMVAVSIGTLATAAAQPGETSWLLPLGFAGIGALGFGLVAQHVVAAAIAQQVSVNRGLAIGVGTAGSTAGQLVLMPLLAFLTQAGHWRMSFLLMAFVCFALVPLVWLALRDPVAKPARLAESDSHRGDLKGDLRTLARAPVFHAIFWSYTICGFTTSGVIETHLIPYSALCGFAPVPSAAAYGILSAVNLFGMIAAGWLSDRVHGPFLLSAIYAARAIAFLLLLHVADNYSLLITFAILFGLFDYSTVPVTASILQARLGLRLLGLSMGVLSAGHAIGGAVGAWAGGAVFDQTGSYDLLWIGSILSALVAAALVIGIRGRGRDLPLGSNA